MYACTVFNKLDPDEVEVGVVARRLPIRIFTGLAPLSEIRICYCFTMRDIAHMLCFKVTFYCNVERSTRYYDDMVGPWVALIPCSFAYISMPLTALRAITYDSPPLVQR